MIQLNDQELQGLNCLCLQEFAVDVFHQDGLEAHKASRVNIIHRAVTTATWVK